MYKRIIVTYHDLSNGCLVCSCLLPFKQLVNRENRLVLYSARPYCPENLPGKWRGRNLWSGCGSMPTRTPLYIIPLPYPSIDPLYPLRSVTTQPIMSSSSSSKPGETM